MSKSAIVTGGNGFIGSYLSNELVIRGYRVIRLIQDTPANRQTNPGQDIRFFDLAKPESMKDICEGGNVVFHLAAIPREQTNFNKEDYIQVNVNGTRCLLEEAAHAGVGRFVYVSTIEAVGPAINSVPLTEETEPHPLNNYGKSKLEAERLVNNFHSGQMTCSVVRLPMIYGPGNYLNVPKLFGAVQRPVFPLIGNGHALMEFCFVGNAVQGLILAGEQEKAAGEIFFISEESRRLRDVISAVAKAENVRPFLFVIPVPLAYILALLIEGAAVVLPFKPFRSPITHKPLFTRKTIEWTTHSVNICSAEKAACVLGYKPPFSLEEGLRITVEDFRKREWIR